MRSLKFLKFWIISILHWWEGNRCCENGSKKTTFYQLHFKVWWWIHKNTFLYWDIIKCYLSKAWYRKTILPSSVFGIDYTVWSIQYRRFEISAAKMKQSCWNKYIEMCTAFKYLHIQSDIEIWVWKFLYLSLLVPIWLMFTFVYIQFICCSLNLDFRFHLAHIFFYFPF